MKSSNLIFLASWVILLVVSSMTLLTAAQSVGVAYFGSGDSLTPEYTLAQIREQGGEQAAKAFRGRRVTAATWALGYALLSIAVILVPYRRGERWAWWAILISVGLPQLLSLARAITLVTTAGTLTPALLLAFFLLGLLAGTPRMFGDRVGPRE